MRLDRVHVVLLGSKSWLCREPFQQTYEQDLVEGHMELLMFLPHSQEFSGFSVAACIAIHSKMLSDSIGNRRDETVQTTQICKIKLISMVCAVH